MSTVAVATPPLWRRIVGFNVLAAILLGVGGFFLGSWIGSKISAGHDYLLGTNQNDVRVFMGFLVGSLGWLLGLGFFNYPVARLLGRPPSVGEHEPGGVGRYFRLCTDHKVVGIQYFFGVGIFFFIGGLNAMLIRT